MPKIPGPPLKHSPPLLEGNRSLCNSPFTPNAKVVLALRPGDVTCEKCWLVMLARHMVQIDDIPVAALRHKHDGLPLMTREERMAAGRRIPLSEVRRMLAEKRGTG